ncbi:MAG: beta-eliminating lyase-related protein [Pseudomonadota bacterium]
MTFASDNWAGASDRVMAVLAEANERLAPAYGNDPWTGRAVDHLRDVFEHDLAVFFVGTGTAANALALATYAKPGGVVFCHVDAHVIRDEAMAPQLLSPGTHLETVDGPEARLSVDQLSDALESYPEGVVHHGRPTAVSITNVNEMGQCYTASDVAEIAAVAKRRGCALHMDGARFANAVAFTGSTPADLTWRAGVDVLSLGLTKTGGWCAEAVVFFDAAVRESAMYRHKQAGQLLSKNRFAAAQFVALLEENHALSLATRANAIAADIAAVLEKSGQATLVYPPQSNEVFAYVSPRARAGMEEAGITVAPWLARSAHTPPAPDAEWKMVRFVASFRTTPADVESLRTALAS